MTSLLVIPEVNGDNSPVRGIGNYHSVKIFTVPFRVIFKEFYSLTKVCLIRVCIRILVGYGV